MEKANASYDLTPQQIQQINRMKHMSINPAYGGTLLMYDDHAIAKVGGMDLRLTLAEAFKL